MAVSKRWSRDELIIALHVYGELPFGSFHKFNSTVIKYSELIERTPSALAMKLGNFASLDPDIISSGRKGLKGASNADREIWAEMHSNWTEFLHEMSEVVSAFHLKGHSSSNAVDIESALNLPDTFVGENRKTQSYVRVGQSLFRKFVLSSYHYRCCISGLSVPELLVASHIVPWKDDDKNRLNPKNGLCLSMIHDKAFDLGMLTVTEDLKVCVSKRYHTDKDQFFLDALIRFDGKSLAVPDKYLPDLDFLAYHREEIFESKVSVCKD